MQKTNLVLEDGYEWIQRGGKLWGTYDVAAPYSGNKRASFPNYVFRHDIKTIKHGRLTLVDKADLDRKSGAA